jgi:hypothetical protein
MFWLGLLIISLEVFFKSVSYELNQKYWSAILALYKISQEYFRVFSLLAPSPV